MSYKDLTGKKFGRWTVISKSDTTLNNSIGWNCVCACGTKRIVSQHSLCRTTNSSKSCGCSHVEISKTTKSRLKYPGSTHERLVFLGYRNNARIRDISFNLKPEDVYKLIHKNCYYCGSSPSNIRSDEYTDETMLYNGVDRLASSKGYELDNVVPCCKNCNFMKQDMSIVEFQMWLKRTYKYLNLSAQNNEIDYSI